jgi:hypothetical protein
MTKMFGRIGWHGMSHGPMCFLSFRMEKNGGFEEDVVMEHRRMGKEKICIISYKEKRKDEVFLGQTINLWNWQGQK